MVKIHTYDKDDGKQTEVEVEGEKLDVLAEIVAAFETVLKNFSPSERFAVLATVAKNTRPGT